jgi:hypothetical protein
VEERLFVSGSAGSATKECVVVFGTVGGVAKRGAPYPGFPVGFLGSTDFMRLSLLKAAHANMSGAAYRKSGSRPFLARCGMPRLCTSRFVASALAGRALPTTKVCCRGNGSHVKGDI